ncbi:MAG: serine/threonine-protein kinase [Pirellulales bacterium]
MQIKQLGPYRIGRMLGRGGMGAVYEGVDVESGNPAAVKVLSVGLAQDEGFRERFEAEIETLKKLHHPNIIQLFGYGEQGGLLFYAMELVEGTSLEDELRARRKFDWREVTQIGLKVCRALRHAHDRGVIHRDLKPGNLLLSMNGQIKLSDFGIARLFGNARMTAAGDVLGTAEYMSPEQADGSPVSPASDLYSLGAVLYALLAGRPPFQAKTLPEMLQMQRFAEPEPVRRYAPETPGELELILLDLLKKEPDERIHDANAVSRRLEAMEHGLSLPLPETRAMPAAHVPTKADEPQIAAAPRGPKGSFTVVDKEKLRREEEPVDLGMGFRSWQTWVLLAALALVGCGVWFLVQPASADRLYGRISAAASRENAEQLLAAEADIRTFLERYADDSRAVEVKSYQDEVELVQLERRLELRARRPFGETLSPIERDLLEAMDAAKVSPDAGIARLQALVDLYEQTNGNSEITRQCLRLARLRLKQLHGQVDRYAADHLALLTKRLNRADQLRRNDPAAAKAIWRAVVELYHDKPWAADAVRRAQAGLGKTAS